MHTPTWTRYAQVDNERHNFEGFPVGIVCVHLEYPKIPGNVVNASTFPFPVMYEMVDFEIERLFEGDDTIEATVIEAAKKLEKQGAKAIAGACGYFAHFQQSVANAVSVPVYMSSLCQLPLIRMGCSLDAQIAVLCANGENLNDDILSQVRETSEGLVVSDVSALESFAPIRWGKGVLDNARLSKDLSELARRLVADNPGIEAVLLECSDLPPYAYDIQHACGLPVYDFTTLIEWVGGAVSRHPFER